MTLPLALLIVGLAAVAAAWHVALRALGHRADRAAIAELAARHANLLSLVKDHGRHIEATTERLDALQERETAHLRSGQELAKRIEQLAAHAAFASARRVRAGTAQ